MNIITLQEAKAANLTHYFTGEPCVHGHLDQRLVSSRSCVACNRDRQKRFEDKKRKEDPNFRRRRHLQETYGLTEQDFDNLLKAQDNSCATCYESFEGKMIYVDHCHSKGHVRGLLCNCCNTALGKVRDNPKTLARMIDYLNR